MIEQEQSVFLMYMKTYVYSLLLLPVRTCVIIFDSQLKSGKSSAYNIV